MNNNIVELKQQICEIGKKLWLLNFVAANDGNISVKLNDGTFLVTPSGVSKYSLTPEMILLVDAKGNVIGEESELKPSSEFKMHLKCYEKRPDILAVVHAHPPTATGYAIADIPLDKMTMPEAIIFLGSVPIAPYGTPSTEEVPAAIEPFLADHDVLLLKNHGALSIGKDLITAYYRMETLEHYAKTTLVATLLGGAKELSGKQLTDCVELRKKFKVEGKHSVKKYSRE